MDIRTLRYFVEVVRQQSFTRAAEKLYVTQPTISKMLKNLEDELNCTLLIRDGRKLLMTDTGQVVWHGQDVTGLSPSQRQALGMARTFQVAQTFEALTVAQNLQLVRARDRLSWWDRLAGREHEQALLDLSQVGLTRQTDAVVADLPYGVKKRLELAMALAGLPAQGERLLLLDEPAAGLAPAERADMMALVRWVAANGVTVLYTEHNMDAVFGVADRVLVLLQGALVADGTP